MNQLLFPVMMRGRSYGITNFVARIVTSTATIIVEYTNHPLFFVLPMSFIAQYTMSLIRQVDFENGWVPSSGCKDKTDGKGNQSDAALQNMDDDEYMAVTDGHADKATRNREDNPTKTSEKIDSETSIEKMPQHDDDYTQIQ